VRLQINVDDTYAVTWKKRQFCFWGRTYYDRHWPEETELRPLKLVQLSDLQCEVSTG
jgi:hypothetical protein